MPPVSVLKSWRRRIWSKDGIFGAFHTKSVKNKKKGRNSWLYGTIKLTTVVKKNIFNLSLASDAVTGNCLCVFVITEIFKKKNEWITDFDLEEQNEKKGKKN